MAMVEAKVVVVVAVVVVVVVVVVHCAVVSNCLMSLCSGSC